MYQRLKEKLVSFGLAIHNKREANRRRLAAVRLFKEDVIRGGQVWRSIASGADYQVLMLTNMYTDGHIQVVYARHWAYMSSMPLEDFLEKFTHNRDVDNTLASAHDDLMAMAYALRPDGRIRKPEEGEVWTRSDRVPDGFNEKREPVFRSQLVSVRILGIVEQSPSQPFVLFEESGERKVLNMYMFLNTYTPEGVKNVA